ncbi:hypothetical protein MP228_006878 [Amoeboaphelidium protococcarum]|nr:hypothetical protein MP228_006878 [Amoeboaphelidium protococcarum]
MPHSTIPCCPITQMPMKDPVIDPDGNSYEKTAILEWLQIHGESPITRRPLTAAQLLPNRALKDLIEGGGGDLSQADSAATQADNLAPALDDQLVKVVKWTHNNYMGVTISGPDSKKPHPIHVCCVIDISGSMGTEATISNQESDGLTLLDLVKHACLTIIESLNAYDKLSLISFSDDAIVELDPTLMTKGGKILAKNALQQLQPTASTYMSKGIKLGIETAAKVPHEHFSSIFILTDGVPTDNLDYRQLIKRQLDQNPVYGSMSTFGFGYSLDTKCLKGIALEGCGSYSFIPDASMVGTIFVNALSNARCVYAVNPQLTFSNPNVKVVGDFKTNVGQESQTVTVQPLRYGQDTTLVFDIKHSSYQPVAITLNFDGINGKHMKVSAVQATANDASLNDHFKVFQIYRAALAVELFAVCVQKREIKVPADVESCRTEYELIDNICKDVEGQVSQALSNDHWYSKWGVHYMVSLGFAHMLQFCNNFKDPGVQGYGGVLFKESVEKLTDLFVSLPAPKPSIQRHASSGRGGSASSAAPVNMSRYYNSGGVCFHPDSLVAMADGSKCPIKDIQKGDEVLRDSGIAKVECLVQTVLQQEFQAFVRMGSCGNLLITPYHPVAVDDQIYKFPIECSSDIVLSTVPSVYNIVLTDGNTISIDGVQCVTLGHSIDSGAAKHKYFGSRRVVEDLKQLAGYDHGFVSMTSDQICRGKDGTVCAIKQVL